MTNTRPFHEQLPLWLRPLLTAYAFLDAALRNEIAKDARPIACFPGCAHCCQQPIPLTLAEVMGIRLYTAQGSIPIQMSATPEATVSAWRCRYLFENRCVVYPVRPFACRRFLVYTHPCAPREDPTSTRPGDVHRPSGAMLLRALRMTLPLYRTLGIEISGQENHDFFTRHTLLLQQL